MPRFRSLRDDASDSPSAWNRRTTSGVPSGEPLSDTASATRSGPWPPARTCAASAPSVSPRYAARL